MNAGEKMHSRRVHGWLMNRGCVDLIGRLCERFISMVCELGFHSVGQEL